VGAGGGGGPGSPGGGHDDIFNRALEANGGMSPGAMGGGQFQGDNDMRAQTPQGDMVGTVPKCGAVRLVQPVSATRSYRSSLPLTLPTSRVCTRDLPQNSMCSCWRKCPKCRQSTQHVTFDGSCHPYSAGYDPPVLDGTGGPNMVGLSPAQIAEIRATAGPDDLPPVMSQGNYGGSYDDRPAVSKASAAEGGTPSRFRQTDPSAQGGNNDEVPAGATGRGQYPPEDEGGDGGDGGQPSPGGGGGGAPEAPEGYSSDLPPPEPIAGNLEKDAGPVIEAFGEYTAMCMYSKNWMHREAALQKMEQQVTAGEVNDNAREVFRTLCQSLSRLFKDKVANVFSSSCKLLTAAVRSMGATLGPREIASGVSQLVPQLLEKLGDAHARVRDAARDAIMELAAAELSLVAAPLVKPVRSQSAWRIVLGRLGIMLELIPQHGLAKAGDHGLTLEAVMEFAAKAFESPNGDVRSTAVKVTLECCAIAGRAVEKFLPKNLKPAIREIIDEGLGKEPGAPPPAAAAPPPPATKPRAVKATPTKGKAATPGKEKAAAAAAPPAPANPTTADLKAEVTAREKELGKEHPDVAVALTDLAALHSEEERFESAQPLYEKALRIQEKSLGAEHQDTVQTLTDLAICHLDQGHNDVGRPLLERALVLQEAALGPNHADVTAIRDVLQSLDADAEEDA
jgi:centrosomal protein CEP104